MWIKTVLIDCNRKEADKRSALDRNTMENTKSKSENTQFTPFTFEEPVYSFSSIYSVMDTMKILSKNDYNPLDVNEVKGIMQKIIKDDVYNYLTYFFKEEKPGYEYNKQINEFSYRLEEYFDFFQSHFVEINDIEWKTLKELCKAAIKVDRIRFEFDNAYPNILNDCNGDDILHKDYFHPNETI